MQSPTGHRRENPRVAVIILNWRRADDTLACLSSILAQDHAPVDIIICDNDSQDGSIERIAEAIGRAPSAAHDFASFAWGAAPPPPAADRFRLWLVATGRNGGYAAGNNVGLKLALADPRVEYCWVLNNDTEVDRAALGHLVARMAHDPAIGLCGAVVRYRGDRGTIQAIGGGRFLADRARCEQIGEGLPVDTRIEGDEIERQMSYVNGAAVLARRGLLERVGLMDEGYFLYWEEIDWATRMRREGSYRLGLEPRAIVYHQVGASTGSNDHGLSSPSSVFWMTRSRLRFLSRFHRSSVAVAVVLVLKATLIELGRGRRARASAMIRGMLAARKPLSELR